MLMRMTIRQLCNRRRNRKIHMILSDKHKELPITKNQAVLDLVAKTGTSNFIPIPSAQQLVRSVKLSLNVFTVRVFNQFSGHVHRKLIQEGKDAEMREGILPWKPKKFGYSNAWYVEHKKYIFSNKNPTWRNNFNLCPTLPAVLDKFEKDTIAKSEAIANALRRRKRQNLTVAERKAMISIKSQSDVLIKKCDKGLGPAIVSKSIYNAQLILTLRSDAYEELTNISVKEIVQLMYENFQKCVAKFRNQPALSAVLYNMDKYHKAAVADPRLCPIELMMKEHKPPSSTGIRTRAIVSLDNYLTGQDSQFLHCMLHPFVFKHRFVLKDSLTFVRMLDELVVLNDNRLRWATYDVQALYPSIDLERGLKSLKWFMETECNFNDNLQDFIMTVARFVLTHSYIYCPEISANIFHQIVGAAMGCSFIVVYAIIHMICIETPIVRKFKKNISMYKRLIDDGIIGWHGSDEDFALFSAAFNEADPSIKVTWTPLSLKADYLDVAMESSGGAIHYEIYSKPGNAYASLPPSSFHVRNSYPAWIRAELLRALTRSSDPSRWAKRCQLFYSKLRETGYGSKFLMTEFAKVTWADRTKALQLKATIASSFDRRCVWSVPNAPGLRELFRSSSLNLAAVEPTIFPPSISTVIKSAKRLSTILRYRAPS